jgi:hypothetical protein
LSEGSFGSKYSQGVIGIFGLLLRRFEQFKVHALLANDCVMHVGRIAKRSTVFPDCDDEAANWAIDAFLLHEVVVHDRGFLVFR